MLTWRKLSPVPALLISATLSMLERTNANDAGAEDRCHDAGIPCGKNRRENGGGHSSRDRRRNHTR